MPAVTQGTQLGEPSQGQWGWVPGVRAREPHPRWCPELPMVSPVSQVPLASLLSLLLVVALAWRVVEPVPGRWGVAGQRGLLWGGRR